MTGVGTDRRRGRIYFGWRVVAALFLCTMSVLGVSIYSFIMFAAPLSGQFGWSAAQTGTLVSAMWVAGPLALVAAPAIERFGPWRLIAAGALIEVLVLVALLGVNAFWQLYLLRMLMGVGKIALMTSAPVIVARWFNQRFGTTMAIVWAGGGAGGLLLSPLTLQLTSALGWRGAALVLAAAIAVCWLCAALIARGPASPADAGLGQDGEHLPGKERRSAEVDLPIRPGWTATMMSINLWAVSVMCAAVLGTGLTAIAFQSQEPLLFAHAGLPASAAALLLGVTAVSALVGSISTGWLLDRVPLRWSCFSVGASMVVGLSLAAWLPQAPYLLLAAAAAATVGFSLGAGDIVWITLFKREFGAAAFPTTYGIFYFSLQTGFAVGGYIGGWSMDHIGVAGFVLVCATMYLPTILFILWRPGTRLAALPAAGV